MFASDVERLLFHRTLPRRQKKKNKSPSPFLRDSWPVPTGFACAPATAAEGSIVKHSYDGLRYLGREQHTRSVLRYRPLALKWGCFLGKVRRPREYVGGKTMSAQSCNVCVVGKKRLVMRCGEVYMFK